MICGNDVADKAPGLRFVIPNHSGTHYSFKLIHRCTIASELTIDTVQFIGLILTGIIISSTYIEIIPTMDVVTSTNVHLMRSQRIDRPHRRKQLASLHGMLDEQSHELEAPFVHFQNRNGSTRMNMIDQSIYTLQERYTSSDIGATSGEINWWNNHDGSM